MTRQHRGIPFQELQHRHERQLPRINNIAGTRECRNISQTTWTRPQVRIVAYRTLTQQEAYPFVGRDIQTDRKKAW